MPHIQGFQAIHFRQGDYWCQVAVGAAIVANDDTAGSEAFSIGLKGLGATNKSKDS